MDPAFAKTFASAWLEAWNAHDLDAILDDVTRFQGGKDRFDDETIIVVRVR